MSCDYPDLEFVADHYHKYVAYSEFLLEIFRMTGIAEALVDHRPFVYRCRNKGIDSTRLQIHDSLFERCHCRFCRLRRRLTRFNENIVRKAVDNIDPFLVCFFGRRNHIRIDLLQIMYLLFIKTEYL